MKIVQNKITDYRNINVTQDSDTWNVNTLYNYGDNVIENNFYYTYAGVDDTNTELSPSNYEDDVFPIWVKNGPTNYFAALDEETLTQTKALNQLIIELNNSNYDTISLLNLSATDVTIELLDSGDDSVIDTKSYNLVNTADIVDEQTYWYNDFDFETSVYEDNIPLATNTYLKITINNTGLDAAVGRLIAGNALALAKTLYPATLDIQSYSRFETDIFGGTKLTKGNSVKKQSWQVTIPIDKVTYIERKRRTLDGVPLLFVMDESTTSKIQNGLVYGYFESAPISIQNGTFVTLNINIKGVL